MAALPVAIAGEGKRGKRSNLPVYAKRDCGEDAFFAVTSNGGVSFVGVADGVGGWGVDVSTQFAWELMNRCEAMAVADPARTAKDVLAGAYQQLLVDKPVEAGSSTVCIGRFDGKTGTLETCNLGDSGYVILRRGQRKFQSEEQELQHNWPFQLAPESPAAHAFIRDYEWRTPGDAQLKSHSLVKGDIVVFATDGVFDNLFVQDIAQLTKPLLKCFDEDLPKPWTNKDVVARLQTVADTIVKNALAAGRSATPTPWGKSHGKEDDVTVIVGVVLDETDRSA